MHKEAVLEGAGAGTAVSELGPHLRQAGFWALCSFGFAKGIEDVLPDPPGPISGVAVVGGIAFVCWLGARIVDPSRNKLSWTWAHVFGALFVAWIVVSNPEAALFGHRGNWALSYTKHWFAMALTAALVWREFEHRALLWCVAAGAAVSALVARSEVIVRDTVDSSLRSGGWSLGPNEAARLYVVAFVIFVMMGASATNRAVRAMGAVGAGIALAGLGATMSRSGFLVAILAIAILIFVALRSRRRAILGVLAVGLTLGALAIPFDYWRVVPVSIVTTDPSDPDQSLAQRLLMWRAALGMAVDRPVTGVGVDRFGDELGNYAPAELPDYRLHAVPHNTYIGLLAEAGIVGFLIFVALIGASIYSLVKRVRAGPLTTTGYTWVVVFVVIMCGGVTIYVPDDALMWMAFGALLTLPEHE